ncbi:ABC transporter permease [Vibrio sp. TH_r3]|uniref:ABC transporter permease n=1 Tax=Vibrio sp. TH_r3 TaxID=3082084 RepID=UPI002954BDEF|nr:ABC transporter permease [Vibrio sp. TH_r3]MDV7103603.1 ABC transporter permease [Vibrio sp. TH_r3]
MNATKIDSQTSTVSSEASAESSRTKQLKAFWKEFAKSKLAVSALVLIVVLMFLAFGSSFIAPQDPYDLANLNWFDAFLQPGKIGTGGYYHVLGTDNVGRDMLSAIFYGLKTSFSIGLTSGIIALSIGILIGLTAAYFGGRVEAILMRIVDLQLALPAMLLALVLVSALGQGIFQIITALVIAQYAYFARTTHGAAKAERGKDYIEAARSTPLPDNYILFKHMLPNILPPLIVVATVQIAGAIALEATLSFLGVGLPITEPSLGSLISNGFKYIHTNRYWLSIFPGIALMIIIIAINLVADHVRHILDPRRAK